MSISHPTPPNSLAGHNIMQNAEPALRWFVCRGNNMVTPLVPADELPSNLSLRNLPKLMPIGDTHGMLNLGNYPPSGLHYTQEDLERNMANGQASDRQKALIPNPSNYTCLMSSDLSRAASYISDPASETAGVFDNGKYKGSLKVLTDRSSLPSNGHEQKPSTVAIHRSLPPSGKEPDQRKKVYCTHWIRHGECDYSQQGCLYKHEMPPDLQTLKAVGFQRYPQWWIHKQIQVRLRQKAATPRAEKLRDHLNHPLPPIGAERNAQRAFLASNAKVGHVSKQLETLDINERQPRKKTVGGLAASKHAQGHLNVSSHPCSSQISGDIDTEQPLIDLNPVSTDLSNNHAPEARPECPSMQKERSFKISSEVSPRIIHPRRFVRNIGFTPLSEEGETTNNTDTTPGFGPAFNPNAEPSRDKSRKLLHKDKTPPSAKNAFKQHTQTYKSSSSGPDQSPLKLKFKRKGKGRKAKYTRPAANSNSSRSDDEDSGFETATGVSVT